jgi:two-component system sensor histidine kinase and response regulator WspE
VSGGDLSDFSMLGLFRVEAETNAQALSDGLMKLEENPSDASLIEPLMRSAHSLKGAARIVQLDAIVTLAHAMEDCFVAAQEGKILLTGEDIDAFLKSVDIFSQIASLDESQIQQFLEDKSSEIEETAGLYDKICKGESSAPVHEEKTEKEEKHEALEHKDLSDFSMLGLFRVEAETNAQALNDGLMKLEENPSDASLIEPRPKAPRITSL